jgi:oligoendopeptidase F
MFGGMDLLPFKDLAPHRPRRFLPKELDLSDWAQVAPWLDSLETRAQSVHSATELAKWVLDWGELSAAIDEESAKRYIAMTCHTDNPTAQEAYLHFLEKIEPQLKPRQFKLAQLYVAHPLRQQLPEERYKVFTRDTKLLVELFRPENVPLETQEAKLSQQYQKLSGSLTVQFRAQEQTLVQMARYQEEPDRTLRQEAWESVANRRLQEERNFDDIFDQLFKLRQQIASNAGFTNYRD